MEQGDSAQDRQKGKRKGKGKDAKKVLEPKGTSERPEFLPYPLYTLKFLINQ